MPRIENVVQASSHDRPRLNWLQHFTCGRCNAVIEYGRGTQWSVVNELANEHWKACPMKPHEQPAHMARTRDFLSNSEVALPSLVASEQRNESNAAIQSVDFQANLWITSGCERKRRTLEQRRLELEQDEYAKDITTKSVVCVGCHKEISLDKRSMYYPGLWHKHKSKCPSIEKLERAKTKVSRGHDSTQHMPWNSIVVPAVGDNSYGDVLQLGPAARCLCHSAATTHLAGGCDLENLSTEDEEEDLLLEVPFPVLNCDFYRAQRTNRWLYRYATKDEITANYFHGQNEPYAHLGHRANTDTALQIGGYCESSGRIIKDWTR